MIRDTGCCFVVSRCLQRVSHVTRLQESLRLGGKINAGIPATINLTMEVGTITETVEYLRRGGAGNYQRHGDHQPHGGADSGSPNTQP